LKIEDPIKGGAFSLAVESAVDLTAQALTDEFNEGLDTDLSERLVFPKKIKTNNCKIAEIL